MQNSNAPSLALILSNRVCSKLFAILSSVSLGVTREKLSFDRNEEANSESIANLKLFDLRESLKFTRLAAQTSL